MNENDVIVKILNNFELRCIVNDFQEYSFNGKKELEDCLTPELSDAIHITFECIAKSDYKGILQLDLTHYGFSTSIINSGSPEDFIRDVIPDDNDICRQVRMIILMFIGIASLQEFTRYNFCGPKHKVDQYNVVSLFIPDNEVTDSEVCSLLSLDGESVYPNVIHPKLLYLSFIILTHLKDQSSFTQKWWLLRSMFIHQLILPEKNESLHSTMVSLMKDICQMDWLKNEEYSTKRLIFYVECCQIFLYYGETIQARNYLRDAQSVTGLEIELDGAMGKRTQYQQKAVAQLFVKLKRNLNFTGTLPDKIGSFPVDLHLQDDILLNKVAFIDDNEYDIDNLFAEEQIVLLGYCCLVQRSSSFDELLQEELMSYINCLLSQPQVWSVYIKALIMRCKAEKTSSRRIERAVMQMEAIVESLKNDSPSLNEREKFFYCTSFPAYWILEKELADLLFSIGCTKSALEIYERLELWEDIVKCYVRLGRTSSAEKIILNQLEKEKESPMLWCLLGDVTGNTEHYLKAWELSNHRSARAQRSLGYYYFQRKEYEKALPYFKSCLEINHLQPQVWFSAGHAATQAEDFEYAARAYRQVVMFDDDNFEAWNNLANAYIKIKQKDRAWRSLQEALKCNYEEWRVWENFLLVSTDVGAFEDALRAWHRLLDIKGKHYDALLLEILVNAIMNNLKDRNGCPSSRLLKRTLELFGRITSIITNEPKVWELYAVLTNFNSEEVAEKDRLEKAVLYFQKAVRSYNQKGSWEKDFNQSKEVLSCSMKLAEISLSYLNLLEGNVKNQQKTSVRLNIQSIIARAKKFHDFFPPDQKSELNESLETLQNFLNDITAL